MRRSICYTEPSTVLAGETDNYRFIYTPAISLPKGCLLRFDLCSKGRVIDWEIPSSDIKSGKNCIYCQIENSKPIAAKEIELEDAYVPLYEFKLPQEVKAGQAIIITLGSIKESDAKKHGNKSQETLQRRRPFNLYIDPSGKGNFQDPETFSLDVKGNKLEYIRILAPSSVTKNRRFDVILRFEDAYGNLTSNADDETLIELTHQNLRENLKWTLFVPETGFIALPNLYFNEPGVYTIELLNVKNGEKFFSSPIKCFPTDVKTYFWGLLHGESERYDSTENIENCLRHFRDERSVNFCAVSPFESAEETPTDIWKSIIQNVDEFNDDDRFTCLVGQQWTGDAKTEGHRQFIFPKGEKNILRKKEQRASNLKKIYNSYSPKELISIPSFTMGKGFSYNFDEFDPNFERVVEIYNAWGSSECTEKEGNTWPIKGPAKKGISEEAHGSILKALLANKRFGFVAGGLDDRGIYQDFFDSDQEQYPPGMTCILADSLSRSNIVDALYNRSCYATTGERIIVGIQLANHGMGSILNTADKPGLAICRHFEGFIAGTDRIEKVELLRNGKLLQEFTSDTNTLDFTFDDLDPISKVTITSDKETPPFLFYYLRVYQEDGHMAWSSPIWIDNTSSEMKIKAKKQKVK